MRIEEVRATPVTAPTTRSCAWSQASGKGTTRTIVEVKTDTGLSGLGETMGEAASVAINETFAPRIAGLDVHERATIRQACIPASIDYGSPYHKVDLMHFAAIEMALWDLIGQQAGLPLYRILGGAVRERAPFVAYAYTVDLAEGYTESDVPRMMAELARRGIAESAARFFEFKVGRHSVECDIETVHAVREAVGPDIAIGVDANMAYTADTVRRFLLGTHKANLANIEEPVEDLAGIEQVRRDFGVPVSTHCTDFDALRAYPLIDSVVGAVDCQGGIEQTIRLAAIARSHGKRYWLRSCNEVGIAWAAMVHLGMACRELDRPGQALINFIEDDLVLGAPWLVKDGGVRPPDKPGLGIELDRAAFEHYAAMHREIGEINYYDEHLTARSASVPG
ncbi:MAG: mandelate racemase/muconate lactonizing enzyme family protein [Burkholderiales bacterium]|nr:mandelate racemase/muconate lactonizing enzyme family protein [Betaproteobacteria bacterium]MBP8296902.1 mandelate racemase/muconate lactonizing enzyme family protein [Burkholderiales bacterium]